MQFLTIDGRLGRDAAIKESSNGKRFLTFTVANNHFGVTEWYEVLSFNEQHFGKFKDCLKKGTSVNVMGDLTIKDKVGNDGTKYQTRTLMAYSIDFAISSQSGSTQSNTTETTQNGSNPKQVAEEMPLINKPKNEETKPSVVVEDDLPF